MGNYSVIIFLSVEIKHFLSMFTLQFKPNIKKPTTWGCGVDLWPMCFPLHSPTLSQWVSLSLSLHLPNDMWAVVYFWLHIYAQDSTTCRKSFFARRTEEFNFKHEWYVIGRLMSGRVMPVGAKGNGSNRLESSQWIREKKTGRCFKWCMGTRWVHFEASWRGP